jgi:hypothetical protein
LQSQWERMRVVSKDPRAAAGATARQKSNGFQLVVYFELRSTSYVGMLSVSSCD